MGFNLPIDSYDKLYVRNENIAAPTTFLDSSTENVKTITANGNAKQLPIKFNKSAGFFNGTTDYVVVPDHADWDFGTGDYDLEFFVMFNTVQTCYMFDINALNLAVRYAAGHLYGYQAGTPRLDYTWTPTANTWYHIRMQRVSGTSKIYVDNVQGGSSYAGSDNIAGGTTGAYIGRDTSNTAFTAGWIKELRLSNVARTVAVPTIQYTSDSNTKLLLHFDTPATSPIAPAIYCDGTADYLSVPTSTDFDFGTGSFCLEGYFKFDVAHSGTHYLISRFRDGGGIACALVITAADILLYVGNSTIAVIYAWSTRVANKWYHLAVTRDGTNARIFIDGKLVATTANTTDVNTSTQAFTCGGSPGQSGLTGSMREIRISNVARYTADFTPSQTGFTVDSNTKLYIKGNEANGATTFVDSETTPKTVTTNGDTKIKYTEDYRSCIFKDDGNTGHKPYPVGSAKVDFFAMSTGVGYFDGTNSYLSVPDDADWDLLATDPVTLETYFRMSTVQSCKFFSRSANADFSIAYAAGTFTFYLSNAAIATFTLTPVANTWYHIAGSKESNAANKTHLFLNGILGTDGTHNTAISTANAINVGRDTAASNYVAGLLENIRIAKGVARYTATFDPPYDPIFNGGGNFFLVF